MKVSGAKMLDTIVSVFIHLDSCALAPVLAM